MKTLIVVESPAKSKKISEILGKDYIVLASYGHINELASGGKYGIGIDIKNNFKPKYLISKDKVKVLEDIINAAQEVDQILLFQDGDREGEAIAYHLFEYLKSSGKPIKRAVFREITKKGIQEGLDNLRNIDMNLVHSQETRRILDRLIGFLVSPFLMNFYGEKLSSGRVQSPTVRMISERDQEIDAFKPEEYWNVSATFETAKKEKFIAKLDYKPKSLKETDALIHKLNTINDFMVSNVKAQKKKVKPDPPLTTIKLQQYMAKKFGISAEDTMKSAQSLYEDGIISYHRSDSVRVSDESLKSLRKWMNENNLDHPKTANAYETKSAAQDAHTAICPTSVDLIPSKILLSRNDKQVYDTIWRFFVASQMNSAVWSSLSVKLTSLSDKNISFSISGKALEYNGYLQLFNTDYDKEINIPLLTKKDLVDILHDKITKEQKFTQPPARFNEFTILKELEKYNIGRPATYGSIISTIFSRNYVERNGSSFRSTDLGKKINSILVNYFKYMEYEYTGLLEKQLDDIADGKIDELKVLNDFFTEFKQKLDQAYLDNGGTLCDKCGSPMRSLTNKKDGSKFLGCGNYPLCFSTKSIIKQAS